MPPRTKTQEAAGQLEQKPAEGDAGQAAGSDVTSEKPLQPTLESAALALAAEATPATVPSPAALLIDRIHEQPEDISWAPVPLPAPTTLTVIAIHPVKHDGRLYGPGLPAGDELEVSAAIAEQLRTVGAIAAD